MQQKCLLSPEVGDMMEIAFSREENKREIEKNKRNIQSGVIRARDRKSSVFIYAPCLKSFSIFLSSAPREKKDFSVFRP